ncbi:MAG TPA: shikimate kinase [Trebonia sp.]|nr:shikimate kinase [Trebonia sp.]
MTDGTNTEAVSPKRRRLGVVLVGPPGAGKSSVGKRLASQLGVPFADTDDLVARAAGKPVGDIFVEDGELVFRELERAAVQQGLDAVARDGGVLALGSGAVLDPDIRRMIGTRTIVYLEAGFATVAKRTGMDRPRVVIPGNPRGQLRAMLDERRPVYAALASVTVSTDAMAPEEVAADLAERLSA